MATQNTQETQGQQSQSSNQQPSAQGQTTSANSGGYASAQSNVQPHTQRSDRERPMHTSREQRQGQGTNVSRRQSGTSAQPWNGGVSPFALMRRLSEDMDRLFTNVGLGSMLTPFLGGNGRDLWSEPLSADITPWSPQVDLFRRGDELIIRADLPGLSKDDISLDVEDNTLTIRGERQQESNEDRDGYYWNERQYGAFQRTIPLPEGANAENTSAQFRDGVLEIAVPAPIQGQRRGKNIQIR